MAGDTSALTLALVASGFTTFDVLAKIAYDSIAAGRDRRAQRAAHFADERRVAYEFLLQRFLDDRLSEFIYGYRVDLGLRVPAGAPKQWPIVPRERVFSLEESERILRSHLPREQKGAGDDSHGQ